MDNTDMKDFAAELRDLADRADSIRATRLKIPTGGLTLPAFIDRMRTLWGSKEYFAVQLDIRFHTCHETPTIEWSGYVKQKSYTGKTLADVFEQMLPKPEEPKQTIEQAVEALELAPAESASDPGLVAAGQPF